MDINADRLWEDVMTLASYTDPELPWTRRSFSERYNIGRNWLKDKMKQAGLTIEVDAAANVIGTYKGKNPNLPPIVIGSHTDTVPSGGRFDGIAGVLAGLEVIRILRENKIILEHSIVLVDFTAEEPSEYGLSTIGSRYWAGNLTKEMLNYTNGSGQTLATAIEYAGGNPREIVKKALKKSASLYLELHIEQGPVLQENGASLGVVSGIVGIRRYNITVKGEPDHAGTTPMDLRKDALNGASELSLELENITSQNFEESVVGTIGEFRVFPNASNVIPGKVEFSVEIRSISENVIDEVAELFFKKVNEVMSKRKLVVDVSFVSKSNPIVVNENIKNLLKKSCYQVTPDLMELPSGAGHDANQMAEICPVGMVFIPCKDGRSHCPEEWSEKKDLANGAQALLNALLIYSRP